MVYYRKQSITKTLLSIELSWSHWDYPFSRAISPWLCLIWRAKLSQAWLVIRCKLLPLSLSCVGLEHCPQRIVIAHLHNYEYVNIYICTFIPTFMYYIYTYIWCPFNNKLIDCVDYIIWTLTVALKAWELRKWVEMEAAASSKFLRDSLELLWDVWLKFLFWMVQTLKSFID